MPNAPVRAAAEGLPNISRRSFLRSAGSAAAVTAVIAAPTVAEALSRPDDTEDLELFRLDAELNFAGEAFKSAESQLIAARVRYEETKPVMPEALIWRNGAGRGLSEREQDELGKTVWPDSDQPRRIYRAELLKRFHGPRRSASGRRLGWTSLEMKQLHEAAVRYEAGCAAARKACGVEQAAIADDHARIDVTRIVAKISDEPAFTLAGIFLKAKAVQMMAAMGELERGHSRLYAGKLARDVVGLAPAGLL